MPFSGFGLHPSLVQGIDALGFDQPTPVQQRALPPALEGRDLLASAMTGSGKTAAFALPLLQHLMGGRRGRTRALVLAPTRELATQIEEHVRTLGRHARVGTAVIVGGVGMGPQEAALRRGVDVVVATPGRLLDHLRRPYARLDALELLVLDEADRMLDMGFLPDVRRILQLLPRKRQTLMFSATLPPPIVALSREMLTDPVSVAVESRSAPASGVSQSAYPVPSALKPALLVELLKRGEIRSVIAFTRTKHRANRLAAFLAKHGVEAGRLHGNRSQAQRTQALSGFKAGRFPVLVATDIAARGIDVTALSHVVNFDVPNSPEDYIHRVGRTARAAAKGDALLFVSPEEESLVRGIERAIGQRLQRRQLEGFDLAGRGVDVSARPPRTHAPRTPRPTPHRHRNSGSTSHPGYRRRRTARRATSPSSL